MYQRKSDGRWCEKIPGRSSPLTAKTKSELKKKIIEYGNYKERGPKIKDALDGWIASREKELTAKGLENYVAPINRLKATFGERYANDLTPDEIQAFVNGLKSKGYNISVVKRPLYALDQTYQWMMVQKDSVVRFNPCSAVKVTGMKQESKELAAREDIKTIKNSLSHPWGLFPYFLLNTGLREQEALALTYEDFNFDEGKIAINKALTWPHNQAVIKSPKTERSKRYVTMLGCVRDALPEKWTGYLFHPEGENRPYTKTEFKTQWLKYCRDLGMVVVEEERHHSDTNNRDYVKHIYKPRVSPHQLRHEFAAMCFAAEVSPDDAAGEMGHTSEEMTRKYAHIEKLLKKSSIGKLDAFVAGGGTVEVKSMPKDIDNA